MAFKRVLIANRGEIALRILRTLRDMGIEAAIIHGREDRLSLPVRMADIAYPIMRANPLDSYLDIEAVVQAAKATLPIATFEDAVVHCCRASPPMAVFSDPVVTC